MLGVFKRRWKPKRVASDSIRPAVPEAVSPEPPERVPRPPTSRQVHPLSGDPNQILAYDATLRQKAKASARDADRRGAFALTPSTPEDGFPGDANRTLSSTNCSSDSASSRDANRALNRNPFGMNYGTDGVASRDPNRGFPSDYSLDGILSRDANRAVLDRSAYPLSPNICVEGGRIEFVKAPPEGASALGSPPSTPASPRSIRNFEEEKFDSDKEALEARIRQLEQRLEAEALSAQKDRLAVARLQHQLSKREGGISRDAERARAEVHARLARAEHEAERAGTRLRSAQHHISRMEETVRSLLQYKSRVEALKQEKSSLSAALEARSIHYQTSLAKLSSENESLRAQVAALEARQARPQDVEDAEDAEDAAPTEARKKQYERCLDDVASQVVRALLSQKGLRSELGRLSVRARDLEAQNRALGALLLRQLRPRAAPSPASPASPPNPQDAQAGVPGGRYDSATISSIASDEFASPPAERLLSSDANVHSEKCLQKARLCKSDDDITSSAVKTDSQKRFSTGNLIVPPCENRLCNGDSIFSFKNEPFSDIMSVCVTHHAYKLSAEDKRRHQILTDLWTELKGIEVTPQSLLQALRAVDPSLWAPPERPLTLNLKVAAPSVLSHCLHRLSQTLPNNIPQPLEDEAAVESPESGNRDEGYSTMSSDVQADPSRQAETNRELEDLKEASDETDNQVLLNIGSALIVEDQIEPDILYIPLNLAVSFNPRNSYPPTKSISAFQHIMRSFSDSHLCLKLTASATQCGENCYSFSSPISSSPSMLLLDVVPILPREKKNHPLRRTRGTASLISPSPVAAEGTGTPDSRSSWISNMDEQVDNIQYDAEYYVQHWLQLDDTRSALQQQHRDLMDLEYDQAELEDWSLNLSCEDLQEGNWKRNSSLGEAQTPGQISLSTLPSIQENNALELEEDASECLWNNSSYMMDNSSDKFAPLSIDNDSDRREESHWPYPPIGNSGLPSPGGSWSSIENSEDCCGNNECLYNNDNLIENDTYKRSSAAMSGCSDEPESSAIGTDFTRDFYRLVKFESTKSLASNSSRGLGAGGGPDSSAPVLRIPDLPITIKQDREQALQNVLNFIAEQQKYCHNREELDSLPSRPTSEIRELPPPFIDNLDFDVDGNTKQLLSTKESQESCRNSFGSEIIYSENESCDIILSNDFRSMYNDVSPDLKVVPRIIDNQNDFYSDSENYSNSKEYQNTENEIDEQHLLKVHQKNEINKSNDISNSPGSLSSEGGVSLTFTSGASKSNDDLKLSTSQYDSGLCTESHDISLHSETKSYSPCAKQEGTSSDIESQPNEITLASLATISKESDYSLLEEVLSACKRTNGILVTVPEEEETALDNSFTQTSDSMTTSISTSDTIASEICNVKKKVLTEKSRIPVPASSIRKHSQIPIKSKSKIPIGETSRIVSKSNINGEASFKSNGVAPGSIIVSQGPSHSRIVSFHEAATSKDVIDELNRMIRKGEEGIGGSDNEGAIIQATNSDKALWCPTGWVHVEREIDFSDPKARANLLDVMLASSDSSPSPTSSCAGSFSSDSGDERADYSRLHKLHRYRRQKKAAALRERGLAVLRFSCFHRPTIIGRDDFYVRYGKQERDAVACFDFLEDISTSINFVTTLEETNPKSLLENQRSQDSGKASERSVQLPYKNGLDSDNSSRETFSGPCVVSLSESETGLDDNTP